MTKQRTANMTRILTAAAIMAATALFVACKPPSAPEIDLNEPPTLVIDSHADGEFVDGLITISGSSADDAGVSSVEVSVDGGTTYGPATGTGAWQISFDTNTVADGNLYIKARATDTGGFKAYAFLTVIVDNAGPGVQIISPQDNQKVSGYVSIVGLGTKVDSVELRIDLGSYQAVTGNYTWYRVWDTTLETEGSHTVDVRPIRSGIPGTEETITVIVDQTVPSVNFAAPAVGAYIKGSTAITGTASDNNGVARVEVSTNGGLNYSTATGTTSWSTSLDTTGLPDGARVLYARATDVTGLLGLASIPVTIDNNAPTAGVTSHASGELVSGVVHLTGTAADGVGLEKVEVKFGPVAYQPADGTTSWNYDFNTVSIPNGSYQVFVRATDFSGNFAETSITLIVDQSFPQVSTISINDGDFLKGTVALSGTVTDGDGTSDIATVEVKVGSGSYQPAVHATGNWTYDLVTTAFTGGSKTVTVRVTDQVGGFTTLSRSVVFDNELPAVAFSSPAHNGQVAGTVLIVGTASDGFSGIASLALEIDGVPQAPSPTLNAGYWSLVWDTDALPHALGPHTLQITATDMAGNAQFAGITVDKSATVPSIGITSHANGDHVRGLMALAGTSAPGSGAVTGVTVTVDAGAPSAATGTTSWSHDIDTTALSDGVHVIYATVTNDGALTTTTQITVTVDNTPPVATITYPTALNNDADSLYGTIDITGTASDTNLDVVDVDIDSGGFGPVTGTAGWNLNWNTATVAGVAKNDVVITARATDKAGNVGTTQVTVDVHPHITALSKYSSFVGDTIVVYGYNFAASSSITFDGAAAVTKSLNTVPDPREYTATIPTGATSGDVVVTTNGIAGAGVHLNIWKIDTAAASGTDYPSLVLDGSNNIYLGFIRGGGIKTVGFTRYNAGTGVWTEATSPIYGSGSTSLDFNIGGGGSPIYSSVGVAGASVYMTYHHAKSGELRIVKSTDGGATFEAPVLVAAGGTYPSLQVYYNAGAGQDYVHIAYYDSVTQDLVLAKSVNSGASFTLETVDSAGSVGAYASLDLDSGRDPHMTYYDATNRTLKFAYWDSASLLWRIKTVDNSIAGEYASLAMGADDSLHTAYYDGSSGDLNYATAASAISTFALQTLDSAGITGWYSSIAVDTNLAPHTAYYDFTYGTVRYAEKTSGSWNTMTVPETAAITQSFTTIGIDSSNIQRIGYASGSGIRVARYLP